MLVKNVNFIRLFIKLILPNDSYIFNSFSNSTRVNGSFLNFFITPKNVFLLTFYLKFSSTLSYTQSLDYFSYPSSLNYDTTSVHLFFLNTYMVYLNIFSNNLNSKIDTNFKSKDSSNNSIASIFYNYWWLEREVSELTDIFFFNKFDNRNLLLEYFILFKPFLKSFPSSGVHELFYDTFNFNLIHSKPSLQL